MEPQVERRLGQAYEQAGNTADAEKYFKAADKVPYYYTVVILNSTIKLAWFKSVWEPHPKKRYWIEDTVNRVRQLWLEDYK